MAPKLYMIAASPPVRSVLILAKALDIELEEKEVDVLGGENLSDEYLKMNPQHTVPTLVDEDGFTLWDSHAIMTYLIAKYGKGDHLYPKDDIKLRATIDQRLHFDTGVIFVRGLIISRSLLFGNATKISQESRNTLTEAYGFLDKFLADNEWVAGNTFTVADIALGTSVTSWDALVPYQEFPNIKAWVERLNSLPFFKEANQPGLEAYTGLIKAKLTEE